MKVYGQFLMQHGVSQHLVSISLFIYYSQSGKVVRLSVWIGHILDTKSCNTGSCEFQFLWAKLVFCFLVFFGLKPGSQTGLKQYWTLAHHAVDSPCDRWSPKLLHWKPAGQRRIARPRQQWGDMLRMPCRYQRLGEWEVVVRDGCNWGTLMANISLCIYKQLFFTCAFHGPPSRIQVSRTHSLARSLTHSLEHSFMYPGNIFPAIYLTADLVIIRCAPTALPTTRVFILACTTWWGVTYLVCLVVFGLRKG